MNSGDLVVNLERHAARHTGRSSNIWWCCAFRSPMLYTPLVSDPVLQVGILALLNLHIRTKVLFLPPVQGRACVKSLKTQFSHLIHHINIPCANKMWRTPMVRTNSSAATMHARSFRFFIPSFYPVSPTVSHFSDRSIISLRRNPCARGSGRLDQDGGETEEWQDLLPVVAFNYESKC